MAASAQIIGNWRRAQAVCFDVDSTVTVGEGIDELADFCGVGEVVAQWCVTPQSARVAT
jgi:phosphoserine phosphatase